MQIRPAQWWSAGSLIGQRLVWSVDRATAHRWSGTGKWAHRSCVPVCPTMPEARSLKNLYERDPRQGIDSLRIRSDKSCRCDTW